MNIHKIEELLSQIASASRQLHRHTVCQNFANLSCIRLHFEYTDTGRAFLSFNCVVQWCSRVNESGFLRSFLNF